MRLRILHVGLLIALLFVASASAQQVDDAKISQMRATIQKLESLSDDANIPVETRENLKELLFEKRGELHGLLRQKRDALRARLQNTTSTTEQASLNAEIRQLNTEMQQLTGAPAAGSVTLERAAPPMTSMGGDASTANLLTPSPTPSSAAPNTASVPVAQPVAAQSASQDFCSQLLNAPAPSTVDYRRELQAVGCRMRLARASGQTGGDAQMDFRNYTMAIALGLAGAKLEKIVVPQMTALAEDASHAKNLSGSNPSSGTTSLVSKAAVPAVFGFAVENGALTRTTNGTTVTFTGTPVGIIESMAKKGFIDSYQTQDDFTAFLRKLSFGLSFDTSRGDQPGTFTGTRQQLSGFSFKYNILDQRDPRHPRYTRRWQEITRKQATKLAVSLNKFVADLATSPNPLFTAWLDETNTALTGKTTYEDIEAVLEIQFQKLADIKTPELDPLVNAVATDLEDFTKERNDILDEISNGWIATFDYNNERPVGSPSLSNFRFLAEKGAYNGSIDFTGNASLTVYNSRPTIPNTQRLRDFRFAGQIDVPIGDVAKTGKFMLSFAGRYERLLTDEPIAGTTAVIRKGDIAAGQLKLTIPIRGTAFKIPLSISFANRTELIQEKEVRGNFGVTFDLDSILAKFNPFTRP